MKSKLTKAAIGGLGVGVGTALYELITNGVGGADYVKVLFAGAFVFIAWSLAFIAWSFVVLLFGADTKKDVPHSENSE